MKVPDSVKNIPEVEVDPNYWLTPGYRGGVSKRVGWWVTTDGHRTHFYTVVFVDGVRSPVKRGVNPVEEVPV